MIVLGKINRVLTDIQKQEAVNLYNSGQSITEIAKLHGVWPNAIRGILKRRKVQFRSLSDSHKKYYTNDTFFDDINSEEKAYVLGLFCADGSNNIKRYKSYIMLAEEDVDILEKIKNLISPDKPLHYQKRKDGNPRHQNRYMFYIDNKRISMQLEKLGCTTNKTYSLKFPRWLSKDLYRHFIRGYFDGDGHIGIYGRKIAVSMTGAEHFCEALKEIFLSEGVEFKVYCRFPERNNGITDIRITKTTSQEKFLDWIYKDSNIYLNRKFHKYLEAKGIRSEIERRLGNSS